MQGFVYLVMKVEIYAHVANEAGEAYHMTLPVKARLMPDLPTERVDTNYLDWPKLCYL